MTETLAERFAAYAVGLHYEVLPAAVVREVKRRVIERHYHNRLIRPRSLYTGPERRAYRPAKAAA